MRSTARKNYAWFPNRSAGRIPATVSDSRRSFDAARIERGRFVNHQSWQNRSMRRIAVYRDGNQMAAQIGPDWVEGIAGFGDTVADALRDLAYSFAEHRYELRGNSVESQWLASSSR